MTNEELFKQALVEGLNRRFDKAIEEAKKIEQIEEMADKLYYNTPILEEETCNIVAEYLYNTGYRKQSETAEKFAKALLKEVNLYLKHYRNPAFSSSWIENRVKEIVARFGAKMKGE